MVRIRTICTVGALIAASLVVVSLAGASSPVKQYTYLAAPRWQVASPGKLGVKLPAEWRVSTKWPDPAASDPVHTTVHWIVGSRLAKKGTTLADVRSSMSQAHPGWVEDGWLPGGRARTAGSTYLALPIGKVLRQTALVVPAEADGGWAARSYTRYYFLDRGVVRQATTGEEREFFSTFTVYCRFDECQTHNGQFAAIMRSLRLTP
jgi:hypothetical protein